MKNPVIFFAVNFFLLAIAVYVNYLVWFDYTTFQNRIIRANKFIQKMGVPDSKWADSYVRSVIYRWIARTISAFLMLLFLLPIILLLLFENSR